MVHWTNARFAMGVWSSMEDVMFAEGSTVSGLVALSAPETLQGNKNPLSYLILFRTLWLQMWYSLYFFFSFVVYFILVACFLRFCLSFLFVDLFSNVFAIVAKEISGPESQASQGSRLSWKTLYWNDDISDGSSYSDTCMHHCHSCCCCINYWIPFWHLPSFIGWILFFLVT